VSGTNEGAHAVEITDLGAHGAAEAGAGRAHRTERAAEAREHPVLTIDNFSVEYKGDRVVKAVKNVTLTLGRGEILGLAGESGCGKSTLAYGINRLLKPPAVITGGSAHFHSREGYVIDLNELSGEDLRAFRWDKIAMVFQGAMNSLNPVITIRSQIEDIFSTHRPDMSKKERRLKCGDLLERVGVDRGRLRSYPHELSGGMRQRVMIAMAMALDPQVMIMDEPTTALDVVVQRDILREITRLRADLGFAVVFITHDLPLLLEISDRIAVMREGEIVELGDAVELYTNPQHEYTKKLLASFPSLTGERGDFIRSGSRNQDGAQA
jgi:peptide/nickel transport system ATP-binding protein